MADYRDYDREEREAENRRSYQDSLREPYLKDGFDVKFGRNYTKDYVYCLVCSCIVHKTGIHRKVCKFEVDTPNEV